MTTTLPLPAVLTGRDRPATTISPSILSSDFARLADECKRMIDLGAHWLHIDVMDGHFVPNLTLGAPIVASLRKHSTAYFDCHLMVTNPAQWVKDFAKAGANMFTFHLEAVVPELGQLSAETAHPAVVELAKAVREAGMHVGVALKPATPVELVFPYVEQGLLDLVLILTVEPGFGGQKFMTPVSQKARALRERYPTLQIEMDGGVDLVTIKTAAADGVNVVVAGTAIFGAADPGLAIKELQAAVDAAAVVAAPS